jgi:hypothetical protein
LSNEVTELTGIAHLKRDCRFALFHQAVISSGDRKDP